MTEEQIVQKVCEIMGVNYSHYDNHNMPINYFGNDNLKSKPKIVTYSGKYGPWEFAILEDMSIITPLSIMGITMIIDTLYDKLKDTGLSPEHQKFYDEMVDTKKRLELSEQFLKENDCVSIINNPNKKVNWV